MTTSSTSNALASRPIRGNWRAVQTLGLNMKMIQRMRTALQRNVSVQLNSPYLPRVLVFLCSCSSRSRQFCLFENNMCLSCEIALPARFWGKLCWEHDNWEFIFYFVTQLSLARTKHDGRLQPFSAPRYERYSEGGEDGGNGDEKISLFSFFLQPVEGDDV